MSRPQIKTMADRETAGEREPLAGCLSSRVQLRERSSSGWSERELVDFVAEECPVALVYNGISHAVMMMSPVHLEDFALGFSLTEGVITHPDQVFGMEIRGDIEAGLEAHLHIHGERLNLLKQTHRHMAGLTGCGMCGKESLEQAMRPIKPLPGAEPPSPDAIQNAVMSLATKQDIQTITGACHAACWCDAEGEIRLTREDVGRHNALDKLIGALSRSDIDAASGFVLVSSRASYEMVYKTATLGIPTLVAVSGATGLAVSAARNSGLNLVGFARPGRQVVYSKVAIP